MTDSNALAAEVFPDSHRAFRVLDATNRFAVFVQVMLTNDHAVLKPPALD